MADTRHIDIGTRLKEIRAKAGKNQGEFASLLNNMTQSNLSSLEAGKSAITLAVIEALVSLYQVDVNWLLFGSGDSDSVQIGETSGMQRRYEAVANAGGGVPSDMMNEHTSVSIPGMPAEAVVVQVAGQSMAPTILDKDYVVCVLVKERNGIRYNEPHLVITKDTVLYVKRIKAHKGGFELVSDNSAYPPIIIKENDIAQLHYVVGRITEHLKGGVELESEERMKRLEAVYEEMRNKLFG